MDAVLLNGAGNGIDVGVEHRQQGDVILRGDEAVGLVEGLDVVGAVVRRQRDAGEDDFAAGVEEGGDDGVEVAARVCDGEAAEAVVAAKFDNHDGGMEVEDLVEPVDAVFAGVAADAGIDHFVVVAAMVERGLKGVGPGVAGFEAIAGGDAVAEAVNDRDAWDGNGMRGRGVGKERGEEDCQDEAATGHTGSLATQGVGVGSRLIAVCYIAIQWSEGRGERMIEVKGLKKSIRNGARVVEILRGIDLVIPKGQFAAIMGASGSGKSTLLGLLAGLDSPSEGEVILDGIAIGKLEEDKLAEVRGQRIGFVFQSYQLIPTLTALENVMLPYELNARGDARKKAEPLLVAVGLQDRLHHYPVQLSGGEQQRVALARAFVMEPPIVLADEPTGNLDSANGQHVLELLGERQRESATTLVLVTHDPQIAERANRRIVLKDGMVVADVMQGAGQSAVGAGAAGAR